MPHGSAAGGGRFGAYGLWLKGVGPELLVPAERDWPELELVRRIGRAEYSIDRLSDTSAEVALAAGGGIFVERRPSRATFTTPSPITDVALTHPYLGTASAVVAYWCGRETFHAGAFIAGGGAWAVLGDREAGKSSLLASLALAGHPIVSDDVLVVEDRHVFAGPRSVDLRETAARALGAGKGIGVVGARERWRLELGAVEPVAPLRGWIFLAWGDEVAANGVPAAKVLTRLAAQRVMRVPPREPASLLRLSGLPAWELQRPRDWGQLQPAAECLLARVA
jgi:hypothetical protein